MIPKLAILKRYSAYIVVSIIITSVTMYFNKSDVPGEEPARPSYANTLLSLTRSIIELEMSEYRYQQSGVSRLAELMPAAGGKPVRCVVVSTWRSGSSFLGHLLSSAPASLYFYEPLKSLDLTAQIRELHDPLAATAIALLKNIMKIDLENVISRKYFEWLQDNSHTLDTKWLKSRFWDGCRRNLCFDIKFLSKFFMLFPVQVFKLDRLRMAVAEQLLLDDGLNVKLVLLVRDPRGVMYSRLRIADFPSEGGAKDPATLCRDLASDHRVAHRIMRAYPGRVMALRFEDLALNLDTSAEQLFQFLKLDLTPSVHTFIQTHSNVSKDGHYSTYRVSRNVPFQWKQGLNFSFIRDIEAQCEEAMALWGYERVTRARRQHMSNYSYI